VLVWIAGEAAGISAPAHTLRPSLATCRCRSRHLLGMPAFRADGSGFALVMQSLRLWSRSARRRSGDALAQFARGGSPMLVSSAAELRFGEEWAFEVKWDGVRALVSVDPAVRVRSRNRHGSHCGVPRVGRPRVPGRSGRWSSSTASRSASTPPPGGPPSSVSWPEPSRGCT
jgi:hypothetical protein